MNCLELKNFAHRDMVWLKKVKRTFWEGTQMVDLINYPALIQVVRNSVLYAGSRWFESSTPDRLERGLINKQKKGLNDMRFIVLVSILIMAPFFNSPVVGPTVTKAQRCTTRCTERCVQWDYGTITNPRRVCLRYETTCETTCW